MTHIVKRRGHKEPFDPRKVYASVYAASLNAHLSSKDAEKIAEKVCGAIERWVANKKEVSSQEIFEEIIRQLKKANREVAFLYETHRDLA